MVDPLSAVVTHPSFPAVFVAVVDPPVIVPPLSDVFATFRRPSSPLLITCLPHSQTCFVTDCCFPLTIILHLDSAGWRECHLFFLFSSFFAGKVTGFRECNFLGHRFARGSVLEYSLMVASVHDARDHCTSFMCFLSGTSIFIYK